jgi:3-oxoacyl-[acyl-carrier protein] reductase
MAQPTEGRRRTAVVTGSTGGIGRAIALRLAREHYNVVLNYSTDDQRAREALDLVNQLTSDVVLVKADVGDKRSVHRLMQEAADTFGTIDVLVNNAARVIDKPLLEMSEPEWDKVVTTNMKGTFLCSQAAALHMLEQEPGGVILNIGASTGITGRRNGINTCASKAGIMIMSQCLALELAPKVRVNTIIPGLTRTDETVARFRLNDPLVLRERQETIPLGRIGRPEDVADAVMMLLSDEAGFITGQKLVVNGGQYIW